MFSNLELHFIKQNDRYYVQLPDEVVNKLDSFVVTISQGQYENYDPYLTEQLENTIVSRFVSAYFFKDKKTLLPKIGFLNLNVKYKNRVIVTTVGELPVDENKSYIVNGVLYE